MAFETHVSIEMGKFGLSTLRVRYHPDLHEVEVLGTTDANGVPFDLHHDGGSVEWDALDRAYEDVLAVVSEIWSDERNMNMRDDAGEVF